MFESAKFPIVLNRAVIQITVFLTIIADSRQRREEGVNYIAQIAEWSA